MGRKFKHEVVTNMRPVFKETQLGINIGGILADSGIQEVFIKLGNGSLTVTSTIFLLTINASTFFVVPQVAAKLLHQVHVST